MNLKDDKDLEKLKEQIFQLCLRNEYYKSASVRITFFREDDELFQENFSEANYLIQARPLGSFGDQWNENDLVHGIYLDMRKNLDYFSNLKRNKFIPLRNGGHLCETE